MVDLQDFREEVLRRVALKVDIKNKFDLGFYGYREFRKDGKTIGFCTHDGWAHVCQEENFFSSMTDHYNNELANLINSNSRVLVRVGEGDPHSKFLQSLRRWKIWNSLVVYTKTSDKVIGHYFIPKDESLEVVNNYLNNAAALEATSKQLDFIVSKIGEDSKFNHLYSDLLSKPMMGSLFSSKTPAQRHLLDGVKIPVKYEGKDYILTKRAVECLLLIADGCVVKELAARLGISSRTAEKHVAKLKAYLELNSKSEMVSFAKKTQLTSLYNDHIY